MLVEIIMEELLKTQEAGAKNYIELLISKEINLVEGTIATVEYDPYRNCKISLVSYADGDKDILFNPLVKSRR